MDAIEEQIEKLLSAAVKMLHFKSHFSSGKVAFSEGQKYCRLTAFVVLKLSERASTMGSRRITEDLEYGFRCASDHLKSAGPRRLEPK